MSEPIDLELLDLLCADLEAVWCETRDRDAVERLIQEHPALAVALREFLEALLNMDAPTKDPGLLAAEDRVWAWIQSGELAAARREHGYPQTTRTSPSKETQVGSPLIPPHAEPLREPEPTEPWFVLVRTRASAKAAVVAAAFPQTTLEFLTLVSRFPHIVPDPVKTTLAASAESRFGIPISESLARLTRPPAVRRAASRDRPFGEGLLDFEDLMERSGLTPEQRAFWRRSATTAFR